MVRTSISRRARRPTSRNRHSSSAADESPSPAPLGKRRHKPTVRFMEYKNLKVEPLSSEDHVGSEQELLEVNVQESVSPKIARSRRNRPRRSDDEDDDLDSRGNDQSDFKCTACGIVLNTRRGLVAHHMHKHKNLPLPGGYRPSSPRANKGRQVHPPTNLILVSGTAEQEETTDDENDDDDDDDEYEEELGPGFANLDIKKEPIENECLPRLPTPQPAVVIGEMCGLEQEEDEQEQEEAVERAKRQMTLKHSRTHVVFDDDDADEEVESYPCKLCENNRVFLTSLGLILHTAKIHPENADQVRHDLQELAAEKKRKQDSKRIVGPGLSRPSTYELLRRGRRSPFSAARERRSVKVAALKLADNGEKENEPAEMEAEADEDEEEDDFDDGGVVRLARRQRAAVVNKASFTVRKPTGRHKKSLQAPKAKYQSCEVCGILINTDHPKAMESHTRAHQRNEELRLELMRNYGPAWVENVTCRECNLVFKDEEKLEQHRRNVHVRRRHFLCRFCGDVFRNMRDLNLHKERRHDAFEGHRRHPDTFDVTGYRRPSDLPALANQMENEPSTVGDAGNAEQFSCCTTCEVCGMQMVRPSNLIRHMKQVHNRTSFTAQVETKGMPPFKVDASEGNFLWGCCDEIYDDRHTFIAHRRTVHGSQAYAGTPRECEHCGMMFRNNLLYINHLRTHRPRICQICGQSFAVASAVDSSLYRAHMLQHKEQGYNVNMPQINEELAQKGYDPSLDISTRLKEMELALDDDELDDNGGSGDDYSIFSESGVESECDDARSICDEHDETHLLTTCPVCDKKFDCVFRFGDHWDLHTKQPNLDTSHLKTRPFSYDTRQSRQAAQHRRFKCTECGLNFLHGGNFALHYLNCKRVRRLGRSKATAKKIVAAEMPTNDTAAPLVEQQVSSPTKDNKVEKLKAALHSNSGGSTTILKRIASTPTLKPLNDQDQLMMDCLEVEPDKGSAYGNLTTPVGNLPEKAYMVEWDTNKITSDTNPYVCMTCKEKLPEFTSLLLHIQSHVEKPICRKKSNEERTKDKMEGLMEPLKDKEQPVEEQDDLKEKIANDETTSGDDDKDSLVRAFVMAVKTAPLTDHGFLTCPICGLKFKEKTMLEEHKHLRHSNRRQTRCDVCGKSFWTAFGLRRHLKRHDLMKFYCNNCDKRFVSYETLTKHQTVHELTYSVYQCEDCVQSLYGLAQLKTHFKASHPGINIVSCPVCARIHTDAQGLDEHFDAEHACTKSKCALCFKYFRTPMNVKEHVKRAHKHTRFYKQFTCRVCNKQLTGANKLVLHMWRHKTSKI